MLMVQERLPVRSKAALMSPSNEGRNGEPKRSRFVTVTRADWPIAQAYSHTTSRAATTAPMRARHHFQKFSRRALVGKAREQSVERDDGEPPIKMTRWS